MDGMLSETTKANGVPRTNNQGASEAIPIDVDDDDGCGATPAAIVCVVNLLGVRKVPTKHRRINGDMASTLDRFVESSARIKRMKMEIAIQLYTNNKKLKMDILQS
jgi:hypothetical protein